MVCGCGVIAETVILHVAANIHATVSKHDVRQVMPHVTHYILHPTIAHRITFLRVKHAIGHVGSSRCPHVWDAARLCPVGALSTATDETLGGNVNGWPVESVCALVTLHRDVGTTCESEDIALVVLADADVSSLLNKHPRLPSTGDSVCLPFVSLGVVNVVSIPFPFQRLKRSAALAAFRLRA